MWKHKKKGGEIMQVTPIIKIRTGSGPDYNVKLLAVVEEGGFKAIEKEIHIRAKQYINQEVDFDYEDVIDEALKKIGVLYEYVDESVYEITMFETAHEGPDEYIVLATITKDGVVLAEKGDTLTFWAEHEKETEFSTASRVRVFILNDELEFIVKIID